MKKKIDMLDVVFWTALIVILFWALAKSFGWIQTPLWLEMVPVFSAVFVAGTVWQKVNSLSSDVDGIKKVMADRFVKLEHEHSLAMSGKLKIKHN